LPRGGFGNLIALPLQHEAREHGNAVFVDDRLVPHADQWAHLASLSRITPTTVEAIAQEAVARGQVIGLRVAPCPVVRWLSIYIHARCKGGLKTMSDKVRVLFLCAHNAARSQLAEALLRHHAGELFEVASAGFRPTEVHPLTRKVLTEVGVDASALRAKPVREFFGRTSVQYAIIVCEPDEVDCPHHFPFAIRTLYWAFDDPTTAQGDLGVARFRRVRDEIDAHIRTWLEELEIPGDAEVTAH
jgi:arsenate reductase